MLLHPGLGSPDGFPSQYSSPRFELPCFLSTEEAAHLRWSPDTQGTPASRSRWRTPSYPLSSNSVLSLSINKTFQLLGAQTLHPHSLSPLKKIKNNLKKNKTRKEYGLVSQSPPCTGPRALTAAAAESCSPQLPRLPLPETAIMAPYTRGSQGV